MLQWFKYKHVMGESLEGAELGLYRSALYTQSEFTYLISIY